MDKIKLTICIEDEEYEERFVKCVLKHYKESYEIHVFDCISEMIKSIEEMDGIIITGDGEWFHQCSFEGQEKILFVLKEEMNKEKECFQKGIIFTEKYQEVYKIMEQVEKMTANDFISKVPFMDHKKIQWIGVFSLESEILQIPFTALLAEILGEKKPVLVMDMQPYSGFSTEMEIGEDAFSMEDLMTIASTGVYTKNRLISSIGHEQKWDYVYPIKNVQCLTEADAAQYRQMISIIQKERGYEQIIINFGAVFPGVADLMSSCDAIYFLTGKRDDKNWREQDFFTRMGIFHGDDFFKKLIWMEIPASSIRGKTWRMLVKEWLWDDIGDKLREINWMEKEDG